MKIGASIERDATVAVNVEGPVPEVEILADSTVNGKIKVNVSGKTPEKGIGRGLLAKIASFLRGDKSHESEKEEDNPNPESYRDANPSRNEGKAQWRKKDGTPYDTYKPSTSVEQDGERTETTIGKESLNR